jgi:hypothetical protein
MATIDTEIEIEVQCECGNELTVKSTDGSRYGFGGKIITVEPCEDCKAEADEEGYNRGYDEREAEEG